MQLGAGGQPRRARVYDRLEGRAGGGGGSSEW